MAGDLDAAETQAVELTREFVVVAGHEDHPRAVPDFAQEFLDDVVMGLRPVETRAHPPAVEDVADEIERVGVVVAQEIEDELRLTAARAQMQVGKEDRSVAAAAVAPSVFSRGAGMAKIRGERMFSVFAQILMSAE